MDQVGWFHEILWNGCAELCLSVEHCDTKRLDSINKCSGLQGFRQGHCEFLFNMVGIYDKMGWLILQVKKDLLSSSGGVCW